MKCSKEQQGKLASYSASAVLKVTNKGMGAAKNQI
jgi:hypothetical protein